MCSDGKFLFQLIDDTVSYINKQIYASALDFSNFAKM